jgi:hypothetical protein
LGEIAEIAEMAGAGLMQIQSILARHLVAGPRNKFGA